MTRNSTTDCPPRWELEQHIIQIASEQLGLEASRIRPGSRLLEDLNCDSLELVELMLALEERFAVAIPEDFGGKLFVQSPLTIGTLAAIVERFWGTGAPKQRRWYERPAEPVAAAPLERPFTQLGGFAADAGAPSTPLHHPLAANEEGVAQWRRRTDGMRCLLIPSARVELGSELPEAEPDERPLHAAEMDAFLLDAEPVSVAAFARFLNSTLEPDSPLVERWCGVGPDDRRRRHFQLRRRSVQLTRQRENWSPVPGTEQQPMVLVSWYGAAAYSLWAHGLEPRDCEQAHRLPTEAQWEYAARGPRAVRFPWGEAAACQEVALTDLHRARRHYGTVLPLAPVHQRLGMSPFGAHHMAGNVWQWCADWYAPEFYAEPLASRRNPEQTIPTGIRAERGGSWVGPAHLARSSFRRGRPPAAVGRCLGFRCAVRVGTGGIELGQRP
ncbi:MAG: SUMF1/EgtB/PvdO family nonheme iron enzyme [Verrucomicrobia bacterium]|nr:SUMF1/EgtB/PvdO family nonheme iron enzyme [Verrucomicrobiota bacterium]